MAYESDADDPPAASASTATRSTLGQFKHRIGLRDDQSNLMGLVFVAPNVAVFSVFLLGPVLYAFYLSFTEYSILTHETSWVALENFRTVMTPLPWENGFEPLRDPTANTWWYSLRNTFIYAIGTVPLQIFGGLAVALMLDKRIRAKSAYRAAFFMPVMLSGAASAVIWRWLLADTGIINEFLAPLGLAHNWAGDPSTALPAVMLMAIWGGIGFNMILFLAGLQNVPEELYEASRIDGASAWQRFRHVTWPNLGNTNFFVIVMAVIGAFQVFGIAIVFEEGGPYYATTTAVLHIYRRAFEENYFGEGAAMAMILFAIIFAFSYWQYRYRKSEEVDY